MWLQCYSLDDLCLLVNFEHLHDLSLVLLFSCLVMSHSLWPQGLQHTRLPCPSLSPRAGSNSCHWVDDAIQPHPLLPPSYPALNLSQHQGLFPMSLLFATDGQSIGAPASASGLPMNIQGWFPLGWTGLISLLSKVWFGFSFCITLETEIFCFTRIQVSLQSEEHKLSGSRCFLRMHLDMFAV